MPHNERPFYGLQALHTLGRTVTYIPVLNDVTGSITASVLLQQIFYWSGLDRGNEVRTFYKFIQPCSHEQYRPGDSWTEELRISYQQINTALKSIATKITSGTSKKSLLKEMKPEHMVFYWTDRNRVTWWQVNPEVVNHFLEKILNGATENPGFPKSLGNSRISNYLGKPRNSNYSLSSEKIYKDDLLHTGEAQITDVGGRNSDKDAEGERQDGKALSIDLNLTEEKGSSKGSEINGDLVSTNEVTLNLGLSHEISEGLKGKSKAINETQNVPKNPLTPNSAPPPFPLPQCQSDTKPGKQPVSRGNTSGQGKARQSNHELVKDLISQCCDDVDGFLAWRGEQLRQTDAYKQGNMTPAVVLQFYAKRISSGPWVSEQDRQCSIDNVQTMIETDVQRYPGKKVKQDAGDDVLGQIFALYQTDKTAAYALAQQHRVWNKFLKEYGHAI